MPYKDKEKQREAGRRWSRHNRQTMNTANQKFRVRRREWYLDLKRGKACEICGESDLVCLDYDHINPNTKTKHVAKLVVEQASKKRILDEIAKCRILCANCHRRETAKVQGRICSVV